MVLIYLRVFLVVAPYHLQENTSEVFAVIPVVWLLVCEEEVVFFQSTHPVRQMVPAMSFCLFLGA